MAKPKKLVQPEQPEENKGAETPVQPQATPEPAAEREVAPETVTPEPQPLPQPVQQMPVMPNQMTSARNRFGSTPISRRFPQVRGGTCEKCGTLDPNLPSQDQYRLCEHYRGMQLGCDYCPDMADPNEVVRTTVLNVAEHPDRPGQLVMWCDRYECGRRHLERFKTSQ